MANRNTRHQPERLELSRFTTREECLRLAQRGCPSSYTEIVKELLADATWTPRLMLFQSMVSRTRGLHEAIVRELECDNPHAVLPLTRAWVEVITINIYVLKNPFYSTVLLTDRRGQNAGARKSFGAMFDAVSDEAPGLRRIYRELSDYTHFGSPGSFNAHTILFGDRPVDPQIRWTDAPHWRDDEHFKIACAQVEQLATASRHYLAAVGRALLEATEAP